MRVCPAISDMKSISLPNPGGNLNLSNFLSDLGSPGDVQPNSQEKPRAASKVATGRTNGSSQGPDHSFGFTDKSRMRRRAVQSRRPANSKFAAAMQELYNPPAPIALAPLKWNLLKIEREHDAGIQQLEHEHSDQRKRLQRTQQGQKKQMTRKLERLLAEEKARTPLAKRLETMHKSEQNLRRLGRTREADAVKVRLDPMEEVFWHKKLGGPGAYFDKARRRQKAQRERHAAEKGTMDTSMKQELHESRRRRDIAVKNQLRRNHKTFEDPWGLHYAAAMGEMDRLEVLIERARVEAEDDPTVLRVALDVRDMDSGRTALQFAAKNARVPALRRLIGLGCNPNLKDPKGMSALHMAAGWGSKEACGLLLQEGADTTMTDLQGRTPLDVARLNMRHENITFLTHWLPVGLTEVERGALAAPDPLPSLQDAAKTSEDDALYLALRGLELKEKAHGSKSEVVAAALARVSQLFRERGRLQEALACLQRQLESVQGVHGDEALETAPVLNNLGELCHAMQRSMEAEACLRRVLRIIDLHQPVGTPVNATATSTALTVSKSSKSASGALSTDDEDEHIRAIAATPVRNLALVYFQNGQFELAEPLLRRHLRYEERDHVGEMNSQSLKLVPSLDILAYVLLLQARFDEALVFYDRARAITERECGANAVQVAPRIENQALVAFCEGNFHRAEQLFKEAHDLLIEAGLDRFDPAVMRICNNMAICQCRRGPSVF